MYDLFDFIGTQSAEHELYCHPQLYQRWEKNIAQPLLIEQGFQVLKWTTGEYDSFGPLTRVCYAVRDNRVFQFVYG